MEQEENKNGQDFKGSFDRSDKYYFKANLIFIIILAVYGVVMLATSIILIFGENPFTGFITLITGVVSIIVAFLVFKLFMSLLADIKYIRNKLYNLEGENDKISESFEKIK